MNIEKVKHVRRARRTQRVRKRVRGTPERPRLAVSRSNRNIYAQIIDDVSGKTLCAVSSQGQEARGQAAYGGNRNAAAVVGRLLGQRARTLGIEQVCFDRRGRSYHGRIKALADAAREAGLKF
ncbi:MAG: 50S ribosomal protein L18 [Phycisphaerae bacterium]|jgi:large subunit ribosomal protein L18